MRSNALMNQSKMAELQKRILFVLFAFLIYRFGSHIPLPGVNQVALAKAMAQSSDGFLGYLNLLSGGAMNRASIMALTLMPYISASIIINLLQLTLPTLQKLRQEGQKGQQQLAQYTRYLTLVLCAFQSLGVSSMLLSMDQVVTINSQYYFMFIVAISLTTGTMFAVWLGEQINERGIGNGISLLIFVGIVSRLPHEIWGMLQGLNEGGLSMIKSLLYLALFVGLLFFIVFVERAQRRIPIHYARRSATVGGSGAVSHLPLKINVAGVIPPIFALALTGMIAQLGHASFLGPFQNVVQELGQGKPYGVLFIGAGIIFFAFFYTALTFDPKDIAKNLKNQGGFVPGIRPGSSTATFIDTILTRLTFVGALYLTLVVLLPNIWHPNQGGFQIGGTGLLISAVVIMDLMTQVQTLLLSDQYGSLMKKSKKSSNASLLR